MASVLKQEMSLFNSIHNNEINGHIEKIYIKDKIELLQMCSTCTHVTSDMSYLKSFKEDIKVKVIKGNVNTLGCYYIDIDVKNKRFRNRYIIKPVGVDFNKPYVVYKEIRNVTYNKDNTSSTIVERKMFIYSPKTNVSLI